MTDITQRRAEPATQQAEAVDVIRAQKAPIPAPEEGITA